MVWLMLSPIAQATPNPTGKLQDLSSKITTLKQTIKTGEAKRSDLTAKLRRSEIAIGQLAKQLTKTQQALAQQTRFLRKLQAKQTAQKQALVQQSALLREQLRALYQLGQHGFLQLLLSQDDPGTLQRQVIYYRYLSQARSQLIQDLANNLTALAVNQGKIIKERARLQSLQDELQATKKALQTKNNARSSIVQGLTRQLKTKKQQLFSACRRQVEMSHFR